MVTIDLLFSDGCRSHSMCIWTHPHSTDICHGQCRRQCPCQLHALCKHQQAHHTHVQSLSLWDACWAMTSQMRSLSGLSASALCRSKSSSFSLFLVTLLLYQTSCTLVTDFCQCLTASFQTRSISDIGTETSLSISKIWWAMILVILLLLHCISFTFIL